MKAKLVNRKMTLPTGMAGAVCFVLTNSQSSQTGRGWRTRAAPGVAQVQRIVEATVGEIYLRSDRVVGQLEQPNFRHKSTKEGLRAERDFGQRAGIPRNG